MRDPRYRRLPLLLIPVLCLVWRGAQAATISLEAEDPNPAGGSPTSLSVVSDVDLTGATYDWEAAALSGEVPELTPDQDKATLTLGEGDVARVSVHVHSATIGDQEASLEIAARTIIELASGDNLSTAVISAPRGAWLVLPEGDWSMPALTIDKDLTIVGAGAFLTTLRSAGGDVITARNVTLNLENLSLYGSRDLTTVLVNAENSDITLQRVRLLYGDIAFAVRDSDVEVENTAVLGVGTLLVGQRGRLLARYSVLGWPLLAHGAPVVGTDQRLALEASVLRWPELYWPVVSCIGSCESTAEASFMLGDEHLDTGAIVPPPPHGLIGEEPSSEAPGFLRSPELVTSVESADLRLRLDGAGTDAGMPDELDPDGSPADVGIFGGPLGDWPDVDNDRDGYSNIDGDCDDLDAGVLPDPVRPERCGEVSSCACDAGVGAGTALGPLLALLVGLSRRAGGCARG